MKLALIPLAALAASCGLSNSPAEDGRACWQQHRDFALCYAKCTAMNPRHAIDAQECVRGVDDEAAGPTQ